VRMREKQMAKSYQLIEQNGKMTVPPYPVN
jgi:hypothetical protein